MKRTILLGLLLTTSLAFVSSQEETVEDLYLKVPAETRIIDSQASSPNRELKSMAIDDLTAMNEEGRLNGNDPFVMRIITDLGAEGTGIISINNGRIVNNFPMVRQKATRLLGNINTVNSANSLIELGEMETESMVLSEIIVGISKNTAADPQLVVDTISRLMEVHGSSKDHNFAYAFLLAVDNLNKNNIEITNNKIFELISNMTLPDSGYIQVVTDKALEVLKNIK
ncbi:hypothetical protein EW093_14560 [Thiospirochaeta perfilievii]|uniref:HEAT repeat domain-containing protein n=1 Tax=Thiospirochaeta perfilievii TaxID=252967 RepID=A0A5C1QE58_9SPIO|nr:hypothetical protein [Thiospirochaeta perfilievii]QEN05871.1 hypothetical protein EW093_14560 [Thiospirochaeta perfilievii]